MKRLLLLSSLLLPYQSFAADGRDDYDLDDNGLIEINDWADMDEIRNNLSGTSLYGEGTGCPISGCNGFELTTDLEFDTNGNGSFDNEDLFWNNGLGWSGIGGSSTPFSAEFDGNGHVIRNLVINRPSSNYQGLFSYVKEANIRRLGLTGPLLSVSSYDEVGALAGYATDSSFAEVFATGNVSTTYRYGNAGGLIGYATGCDVRTAFTLGQVTGYYTGGIAGEGSPNTFHDVFSTANLDSPYESWGIAESGDVFNSYTAGSFRGGARKYPLTQYGTVEASYWLRVPVYVSRSIGVSASLEKLQCPTSADNVTCANNSLYVGWSEAAAGEESPWDFGDATQLPGLRLNNIVYRDSDFDGAVDHDDDFPQIFAASSDRDGDGFPDIWHYNCGASCRADSGLVFDQFPDDDAAAIDGDLDGFPDTWNEGCDANCQTDSALTLDNYPNDSDEDGIPNDEDDDDNGDGVQDVDSDSNGLIEISTLAQLNAIRFAPNGKGRQLDETDFDASGCPINMFASPPAAECHGYELTTDLDFDTNGNGKLDVGDDFWNNGRGWETVASFSATLDGNGHEIRNLLVIPNESGGGFMGTVSDASLRNFTLTNVSVTVSEGDCAGALFDEGDAVEVHSVRASGIVIAAESAGGLIGCLNEGSITDSHWQGTVTGSTSTGGLVGELESVSIRRSSALATVVSESGRAGGLVGNAHELTIDDSYAAGKVKGEVRAGGLIGEAFDTKISRAWVHAEVTGDAQAGGLIGQGDELFITNAYADGSVHGGWSVGGFIGYFDDGLVMNTYATGLVTSDEYAGGLVGDGFKGQTLNSYWALDATGQAESFGGDGFLLVELTCPATGNDHSCAESVLYVDWPTAQIENGISGWHFGAADELPSLVIGRFASRDLDGDGYSGFDDAAPLNGGAITDADGDGVADSWLSSCDQACQTATGAELDAFPLSAAASVDRDGDGMPDEWNAGCDEECQQTSGLTLDHDTGEPSKGNEGEGGDESEDGDNDADPEKEDEEDVVTPAPSEPSPANGNSGGSGGGGSTSYLMLAFLLLAVIARQRRKVQ